MIYFLLILNCVLTPIQNTDAAGPEPVVKWATEMEHDFGSIRKGDTQRFVFRFQNILREPIVLETVRTTCGCTAADWPEAPIEPEAFGDVLIDFDANKTGFFRKKITVFFDKQRKPETLWITGEVF